MDFQAVLDEQAIIRCLGRFARVLDNREWDRIGDVFAADVVFDYGDGREQSGIEALRQQFRRFLDVCGPSQHLLGSIIVSVDGDGVTSRAYVQARHQGAGEIPSFFDANGEYVDRWQRLPEGWRIVRRDVRWLMHMGDPAVLGLV